MISNNQDKKINKFGKIRATIVESFNECIQQIFSEFILNRVYDFYRYDELKKLPTIINTDERNRIKEYWDSIVKVSYKEKIATGFLLPYPELRYAVVTNYSMIPQWENDLKSIKILVSGFECPVTK